MIALNFTLVVQLVLFLIFLWVTNTMVFRPLLKTMDARTAKVADDQAKAETDARDAERLEGQYTNRLTNAHQVASQRLHKARYDAYQQNRTSLDELKRRADTDVANYRATMDGMIETERQKLPGMIPAIVDAMDRQVSAEGTLLNEKLLHEVRQR
jgi:F-type H+-transporting ATPase subunit b